MFISKTFVVKVVAVTVTANQVIRVERNVPILPIVLVQFLQMVYRCPLAYDFATEIADAPVTGNHIKSRLLPLFRFV